MNHFYVYQYLRETDSVTGPAGSPYYVGKGHGDRAYAKNRKRTKPPANRENIVIVKSGLTEPEAFDLEKRLIRWFGRVDQGTGILRNLTDGGEGSCGFQHSEETKNRIKELNTGRVWTPETIEKRAMAMRGRKLPKDLLERRAKTRSKQWTITRPDGSIDHVVNLCEYARQNGLSATTLTKVARGHRAHYKGFRATYA